MFDVYGTVYYRYLYGGQEFVSSRLNVSPGSYTSFTEWDSQAYMERNYPVGSVVTAYVHPKNPAYAILEPGISNPLFFYYFRC